MQLRRPIAALVTTLALFGGGATITACGAPTTPNEGTTEEGGSTEEGSSGEQLSPEEADRENMPDSHDAGVNDDNEETGG